MAAMERGDPVMIFAGYSAKMKEFLSANPGLSSRIKYKFTFPNYSVQEMATILENGIRESGYRYEGETNLSDILKKGTTKEVQNQQSGRLAKNILRETIINVSSCLLFEEEPTRLMILEDEDVIQGVGLFGSQLNHHARIPEDPKLQSQSNVFFFLDRLTFFTLEFFISIVKDNS